MIRDYDTVFCMDQDHSHYYQAYCARDTRFDGVFFVGVKTTGIYCRPVCTARTPKRENCVFFRSAAAAEQESYRPCLKCRPELAPGLAPVDDSGRVANAIATQLQSTPDGEKHDLEQIADQFQLSSRQVRRIIKKEYGVTPIQLIQTNRLLLAKQLLTETGLPVTQIAYASGFSSLRRFNDAFSRYYNMPPSHMRKNAVTKNMAADSTIELRLNYRPPYDWASMLDFLDTRRIQNVELIRNACYSRTVRSGNHKGFVRVSHVPEKSALQVAVAYSLLPVLPAVLERVRQLFDVKSNPVMINEHLSKDGRFSQSIQAHPGLRLPGCFDEFEMTVRAIIGQQISVRAAATIAGRFADCFGDAIECNDAELCRLAPEPQRVASATVDEVAALGINRRRSETILAVARQIADGRLIVGSGHSPESFIDRITQIPGIGPWTGHYIAMRALGWPDAFPKEDVVLQKSLGGVTAEQAETLSQKWKPWRSYAVMHLWKRHQGLQNTISEQGAESHVL